MKKSFKHGGNGRNVKEKEDRGWDNMWPIVLQRRRNMHCGETNMIGIKTNKSWMRSGGKMKTWVRRGWRWGGRRRCRGRKKQGKRSQEKGKWKNKIVCRGARGTGRGQDDGSRERDEGWNGSGPELLVYWWESIRAFCCLPQPQNRTVKYCILQIRCKIWN